MAEIPDSDLEIELTSDTEIAEELTADAMLDSDTELELTSDTEVVGELTADAMLDSDTELALTSELFEVTDSVVDRLDDDSIEVLIVELNSDEEDCSGSIPSISSSTSSQPMVLVSDKGEL